MLQAAPLLEPLLGLPFFRWKHPPTSCPVQLVTWLPRFEPFLFLKCHFLGEVFLASLSNPMTDSVLCCCLQSMRHQPLWWGCVCAGGLPISRGEWQRAPCLSSSPLSSSTQHAEGVYLNEGSGRSGTSASLLSVAKPRGFCLQRISGSSFISVSSPHPVDLSNAKPLALSDYRTR